MSIAGQLRNRSKAVDKQWLWIKIWTQADCREYSQDLPILHEPAPDVSGAHVFGAQKNYAGVDSNYVGVGPGGLRVEGVDEAVFAVDFRAVLIKHRLQGAGGEVGSEHQGAAGGGGDDGAVDVGVARWATPGEIAFGAVRGSDAPDVWSKCRKLVREIYAEGTMREGGGDGVLEVVDAIASRLAPIAIVDPGVRVLVHE